MRRRWIWTPGGLVEVSADYVPRPRVHIIGDTIEPMRSMADGRHYTSKSKYYADVRARGLEIAGNEASAVTERPDCRPQGVRDDLRKVAAEMGLAVR